MSDGLSPPCAPTMRRPLHPVHVPEVYPGVHKPPDKPHKPWFRRGLRRLSAPFRHNIVAFRAIRDRARICRGNADFMTTRPMRGIVPLVLAGAAVVLALEFLKPAPPASAERDPAELARIAERLLAVPGADGLMTACPADIQGTWRSRPGLFPRRARAVTVEACAADLRRCGESCLEGSGEACTWTAFILEAQDEALTEAARHSYAMGCALGDPSGCTNRGANIRNAPQPYDPLSLLPVSRNAACLYTTFSAACAGDDAWGCAMSGQTYALGEGVAQDRETAARLYRLACTVSGERPDDEAAMAPCRFARGRLAALEVTE